MPVGPVVQYPLDGSAAIIRPPPYAWERTEAPAPRRVPGGQRHAECRDQHQRECHTSRQQELERAAPSGVAHLVPPDPWTSDREGDEQCAHGWFGGPANSTSPVALRPPLAGGLPFRSVVNVDEASRARTRGFWTICGLFAARLPVPGPCLDRAWACQAAGPAPASARPSGTCQVRRVPPSREVPNSTAPPRRSARWRRFLRPRPAALASPCRPRRRRRRGAGPRRRRS